MNSVQSGSRVASEISGKPFRFNSKNLLQSSIRSAGLCSSCITSPSCNSSDALLKAAMEYGASVVSKKKEQRVPRFTTRVSRDEILASSPIECAICLCNLEACDDASQITALRLGCGHAFHPDCIKRWLPKNSSCPTCRWQCQKMRHPRFKAAARRDDDGWVDQPLQVGDMVSLDLFNNGCRRVGKIVRIEDDQDDVVVELKYSRECYSRSAHELELLSDEALEAAEAQFGHFAPRQREVFSSSH